MDRLNLSRANQFNFMIYALLFAFLSKADPLEPDCWKRRGQTRAALGHAVGALSDLDRAVELFNGRDPDVLHQRGMVYHKVGVVQVFLPLGAYCG